MPTRVDVAVEAAREEISTGVKRIEENNLASTPAFDDGVSSRLFREEAQRQEMRYLDRILPGKKPGADGSARQSQSEGEAAGAAGSGSGNRHKEQPESSKRSKIESILCQYDRRDDKSASNRSRGQGDSLETRNKQPIKNNVSRNTPNLNNISRKVHEKISTFIHNNQPKKSKPGRHQKPIQKRTRTAVPSRNKRRQINNKFIQRGRLSSRKVIAQVVRLGRHCTRNLTTVKHAIDLSVAKAVASAHLMLKEASAHESGKSTARQQGQSDIKFKENGMKAWGTCVANTGQAKSGAKEGGHATASLPQDVSSFRVPPRHAFALAPSWMMSSAERASSRVVAVVRKTIRDGRVMKG